MDEDAIRKRVTVALVCLAQTYNATRFDVITGAASIQHLDYEEEHENILSRLRPPQQVIRTFA